MYLYIADSEYTYGEMEGEMKAKLMALADDACTYIHGERYEVMLEAPSAIVWVAKGVLCPRFEGPALEEFQCIV